MKLFRITYGGDDVIETLREMRLKAGFKTQNALAMYMGTKRVTVTKWETGAAYPRHKKLPILAKVLSMTEGEIISAIMEASHAHPCHHPSIEFVRYYTIS